MKILLIGKTGQLGNDILKIASKDFEVIAPSRNELDIAVQESIYETINTIKPDVVINTAAFHNVPLCEIEYEQAFKINCIAVRELAILCKKQHSIFITFSTDYVFDGQKRAPYNEDDCPMPLQVYGTSKLAGEFMALSNWPDKTIIIRTCGLYGLTGASSKGGNFVDKRIMDAKLNDYIEISNDQIVCPTFTQDLANAVISMIKQKINSGIYHLVNDGQCSWYDFTKEIYKLMKINVTLKSVDRKGLSGNMRRPLYSVLANTKAKLMGISLFPWQNALERYINIKYLNK